MRRVPRASLTFSSRKISGSRVLLVISPTAAFWIAEAISPVLDTVGLLEIALSIFPVDGLAEHSVMPFETFDVIGRLNQELEQVQKCGRVLGLWVERIEVRSFHFDGITEGPAPFPVEIQVLPAVADRGPDLAPSGFRPQHIDDHPSAVTAGLVAIELQEAVFPIRKILRLCHGNGPGFSRSHL